MDQSINDILKLIDDSINKFQESIPGIQKTLMAELQPLIRQLAVKDGRILNNIENLKLIGNLKNKLQGIIISADYQKNVQQFIDNYQALSDLHNEYFRQFNKKFSPAETLKIIRELAVETTINDLLGQGMRAEVINPVIDIINQNITTGGSYFDFQEQIRNHIISDKQGDGSLERYTKQITTDAINQYSAQYNQAIAADLKFNWGRYVGSNITTSRQFCILLTAKDYVHRSELHDIIKGEIDGQKCKLSKTTGLPLGMIPDTTVDNFKIRRGGYNCRHQFFWVPDNVVPMNIRRKFAA